MNMHFQFAALISFEHEIAISTHTHNYSISCWTNASFGPLGLWRHSYIACWPHWDKCILISIKYSQNLNIPKLIDAAIKLIEIN